jgi:hypothetical protein
MQGENIIGKPEVVLPYRLGFKTTESVCGTHITTIYQSDHVMAPARKEPSVHTLDKLHWSCPRLDHELPLEKTPLGNWVRVLNYEVKINIVGQAAEAAITCHGQQTGGLKINLDPDKSLWDQATSSSTASHSGWKLPGASGAKTVKDNGKGAGKTKTTTTNTGNKSKTKSKTKSKDAETDDDQDYE